MDLKIRPVVDINISQNTMDPKNLLTSLSHFETNLIRLFWRLYADLLNYIV